MPWSREYFPRAKRPLKLPVILSHEEILAFFDNIPSIKYRAAMMTCYGAGLRVSEAAALKVSDIDSQRMLIRVEQGKGRKVRYVMLSPRLLDVLCRYWRAFPSQDYLFPSWRENRHMCSGTLQMACRQAAAQAGLCKRVTVHTLRRNFATHLLEGSTDIRIIQALLAAERAIVVSGYAAGVDMNAHCAALKAGKDYDHSAGGRYPAIPREAGNSRVLGPEPDSGRERIWRQPAVECEPCHEPKSHHLPTLARYGVDRSTGDGRKHTGRPGLSALGVAALCRCL
jgi:hypothetical protein